MAMPSLNGSRDGFHGQINVGHSAEPMNNIEEGILGEFVEAHGSRRSGSMANVHVERLAACWANELAPWLVEEAIPRRLVELDHGDRVGRHATPIVEERDLAARHD